MAVFNSTKALLKDQLNKLNQLTNPDKVLRLAVVTMVPEMKNRIQQDGKKSDGSQIGQYSTKSLSFGPITNRFYDNATQKQFAKRFKGNSSPGTFSGGYKQLRQELGRQVAFVDLTLTGDMMRDMKPGPTGPNSYGIGFLSSEQHKIAQYNEKHFGITFDPTEQELKQSLVTINKAISSILSK